MDWDRDRSNGTSTMCWAALSMSDMVLASRARVSWVVPGKRSWLPLTAFVDLEVPVLPFLTGLRVFLSSSTRSSHPSYVLYVLPDLVVFDTTEDSEV